MKAAQETSEAVEEACEGAEAVVAAEEVVEVVRQEGILGGLVAELTYNDEEVAILAESEYFNFFLFDQRRFFR
jgi:hypothetical protein